MTNRKQILISALINCCFATKSIVIWSLSCVWLFATPQTSACQVPLSMGLSRQEYWSGLSCPLPGDLPTSGPPALQADSLPLSHQASPHRKCIEHWIWSLCQDAKFSTNTKFSMPSALTLPHQSSQSGSPPSPGALVLPLGPQQRLLGWVFDSLSGTTGLDQRQHAPFNVLPSLVLQQEISINEMEWVKTSFIHSCLWILLSEDTNIH